MAARILPRVLPVTSLSTLRSTSHLKSLSPLSINRFSVSFSSSISLLFSIRRRCLSDVWRCGDEWSVKKGIFAEQRGYRKLRRRAVKNKEKELELCVKICVEEQLPEDPETLVYFCVFFCVYQWLVLKMCFCCSCYVVYDLFMK